MLRERRRGRRRSLARADARPHLLPQQRIRPERLAQREQVARTGAAQRHLGEQPLQVEHAGQLLAQLGAQDGRGQQLAHRVEPGFDLGLVERRAQQALPQQAPAHAGGRLVEHAEQRRRFSQRHIVGENGLDQFQIAHGDGVEHHAVGAVVVGGAVEMVERGALRVAQIVQDGARRRTDGGGPARPAAIEREQVEVIAQHAVGVVEAEDPVFELGAHVARAFSCEVSSGKSAGNSTSRAPRCSSAAGISSGVELGDAEFAGRDVHVRQARARPRRATAAR